MRKGLAHPDCREFVTVVDALLARRRGELAAGPGAVPAWRLSDWGPRTWTQTEFEDTVYGSFKPMRQGRVTRPPRRETVMEIADYLNCTLEERNRLLVAARATPVAPYLSGPQLAEVLPVAEAVARALSVPAVIINRDWRIHYLNVHALALNGVGPDAVAAIPAAKRNILHLLFDPDLPLYPHLSRNRASWTRMARQTIFGFKLANQLCQFETWYQGLLEQLLALPEFETHWQSVNVDAGFDTDPSARGQAASVVVETTIPGQPGGARLRPLLISVGYFQFDFPQVVAFLPVDDASRDALRTIGIPVPDAFTAPAA